MEERLSHLCLLIVFTASLIVAVGLVLGATAHAATANPPSGAILAPIAVSLSLVVVGTCLALLHLGRPSRAWQTIRGATHSWLSREALFTAGFSFCTGSGAWLLHSGGVNSASMVVLSLGCALGVSTVWSVVMIYRQPAQHSWNRWSTRAAPLTGTTLVGSAVTLLLADSPASWGSVLFFCLALSLDAAFGLTRILQSKRTRYASIYPRMRPLITAAHGVRLALVAVIATTVFFELYLITVLAISLLIFLDRFVFYAGAVQVTPKNEIGALRAKRMRAVLTASSTPTRS